MECDPADDDDGLPREASADGLDVVVDGEVDEDADEDADGRVGIPDLGECGRADWLVD